MKRKAKPGPHAYTRQKVDPPGQRQSELEGYVVTLVVDFAVRGEHRLERPIHHPQPVAEGVAHPRDAENEHPPDIKDNEIGEGARSRRLIASLGHLGQIGRRQHGRT